VKALGHPEGVDGRRDARHSAAQSSQRSYVRVADLDS
jgi:hypothetical protein